MATIVKVNNKSVKLTVEEKARLLTVFDINEEGRLAVTSGTKPNSAYVVHHDGHKVNHCPCPCYGRCSHMVAGDWYLEAVNRVHYDNLYDVNCVA